MDLLVALLDVVAHTLGLWNLFLLWLLWKRDRDVLYLREFCLMGAFSLVVVQQSLHAALGSTMPGWLQTAGGFLAMSGVSLMIFALPWYVNNLEGGLSLRLPQAVFSGAAGLSFAGVVAGLVLDGPLMRVLPGFGGGADALAMGLCIAAIAYTLVQAVAAVLGPLLSSRKKARAPALEQTTRLAVRMGLLTLVLMPVLLWLDFMNNAVPGLPRLKVLPMEYLLWSVLLMSVRVRTILELPVSCTGESGADVDGFCNAAGISPREREVMDLLVRGTTYEAIADKLCISLATVKTHVHRIYRKTGVCSKVELLHRLQAPNQPEG